MTHLGSAPQRPGNLVDGAHHGPRARPDREREHVEVRPQLQCQVELSQKDTLSHSTRAEDDAALAFFDAREHIGE
jgi:hypothetical protein